MDLGFDTAETHFMSFDPGLATGWAIFDVQGNTIGFGTCSTHEELMDFLGDFKGKPKVVIYENFRLMKRKAVQQSGSEMPASVAIGIVKMFARRWKAELVKQEASIKPMAEMMSGYKPTGPHRFTHHIDALNHGVYYLVRKHIRKSVGELELERRGK